MGTGGEQGHLLCRCGRFKLCSGVLFLYAASGLSCVLRSAFGRPGWPRQSRGTREARTRHKERNAGTEVRRDGGAQRAGALRCSTPVFVLFTLTCQARRAQRFRGFARSSDFPPLRALKR